MIKTTNKILNFPANTIVICKVPDYILESDFKTDFDIENGERVLCLGEIVNMPGHGIFVNKNGKIIWGVHKDYFRLPNENEI